MSQQIVSLMIQGLGETLQMTIISVVVAMIVGVPLGVVLVITGKGHILENLPLNRVLGAIVNALRSIPNLIIIMEISLSFFPFLL